MKRFCLLYNLRQNKAVERIEISTQTINNIYYGKWNDKITDLNEQEVEDKMQIHDLLFSYLEFVQQ